MKTHIRLSVFFLLPLLLGGIAFLFLRDFRPAGGGERLTVSCAAGLRVPVEQLAEEYERMTGTRIDLQFGGSGTLLANLSVSRQGDLFIAGDTAYLEMARDDGLVNEVLPLATMHPVIAVPIGNPAGIGNVSDLLAKNLRVALGNPGTAAIGTVTKEALEATGQWENLRASVEERGVFKPTVNELANDVLIGAVDAAIVWDATAGATGKLTGIEAPELAGHTTQVAAGVLRSSTQPTATLRFARFLNSRNAAPTFAAAGFNPVSGDLWAPEPQLNFFCGAVNRAAVAPVIESFEQREGVKINAIYNGCGMLTAQMRTIRESAPGGEGTGFPDIYMACDRYYLDNVQQWFVGGRDISRTSIIIAVPKGNPANIGSLDDLTRPGVKVTVGQPEQCTIGALTRILLEEAGLYDSVMANVVMQTASSAMLVPTVATRSADATIAYLTDTRAQADRIEVIDIPLPSAVAIQPFSVAQGTPYPFLANRFLDHLLASQESIEAAGFKFLGDNSEPTSED